MQRGKSIPKSSIYERELKEILQGNESVIEKYVKGLSEIERCSIMKILKFPFLVIRGAGSLSVDLVALRSDFSFPIEVKSSSERTFWFSRNEKTALQLKNFMDKCSKIGVIPIYAFYLKSFRGDSWRIFTAEIQNISGRTRILYEHIPKIEKTKEGNFIMRWEDGMELHKFIDYLDFIWQKHKLY